MMTDYEARLKAFEGRVLVTRRQGQDPVNKPMIRHWVEALDMPADIHLDEESARSTGRSDVVAPAAMTQAWIMRGYAATVNPPEQRDGFDELVDLLAEGGYTSVVATDSDFEFFRELVPGDLVSYEEVVENISEEKTTGLGRGRFITTKKIYFDESEEVVATQLWRTLRFDPRN